MNPWCHLSDEVNIDDGQYYQATLMTRSGLPLHLEPEFLDHLAELMMQRYEGLPGSKTITLPDSGSSNPRRTKHHYRRLFDFNRTPAEITQEFITCASEALGLWIEISREKTLYAEGGIPHASDPAYDVLSIANDSKNMPHLRVVQVKATDKNVQGASNIAIKKFERLEAGDYDAELSARLELIQRRRDSPAGIRIADLLFDAGRCYRVTIIHGQSLDTLRILTTFSDKVPGPAERRSAYLVRAAIPEFWQVLGQRVYDQLI